MDYQSLILVVDDQPYARLALASLLEADGYRLAFAADGFEALDMAARLRPDLLLLDVMMPNMDGFEVCRRLRADPRTADLPLIMVTALDDQHSLLKGIEAGADDFISKPFNRAELRARVRTVTRLNRYRRLWENRERYDQLVDSSPNGVLIIDQAGVIRLANPAALTLLDAAPDTLIERGVAQIIAPDRLADVVGQLDALTAGSLAHVHIETILITQSGLRRPVALDAGRCQWDARPAIQLLVRDITDQKRAELLDAERRQVAYDLHDGVAQLATSMYQHIQLYERRHRPRSSAATAALNQLQNMARQTVIEIRRVIEGLRPSALDDFGLAGALGMLVEALRSEGLQLTFNAQLGEQRLPVPVETALFRVAQEALTNTVKHSGERRADLSVTRDDKAVWLKVRDWGHGFDPADIMRPSGIGQRLGLHAMRERAALLGGELRIETGPGLGVEIVAMIPLIGTVLGAVSDER
ncbi:MAG: response regulator [Chloroflexales bacterium]